MHNPDHASTVRTEAPIVIVGSGLAGYGLAREVRRHDQQVPITILTADGGEVYSKPLLSTGYTKNLDLAKLTLQTADELAEQIGVTIRSRCQVAAIDRDKKCVSLDDGSAHTYSRLVLCLGAEVIRPSMTGDALDQVLTVNDLDDYGQFQHALSTRDARRVAIIGAGLIGCEFTNDLLNGGFSTVSVDPMAHCLPTLLPRECGIAVGEALEAKGAQFIFGNFVTEVNHHADGFRLSLDSGETIDADAVLSAVGVRPRIDLATRAGLEVGRGIKTDRFLRTSDPNIYAMGDCAEVMGHVLVYVAPLMAAARSLGATLAGNNTAVTYPAMPVTIKTPACPVTVCPPSRDIEGSWRIEGTAPHLKAFFHDSMGALRGFALTGNTIREKAALTKQLPGMLD